MPSENNKKIAINTLFLYLRMILVMLITLYTSRVVLSRLGINDYGIYNVVGGIVSMFTILSSSLTSAISRFLTFELGRDNVNRLRSVFSTSVIIQGLLGMVIVLLVELVGVWFLNNKMNIATGRLVAANWVLQCSTVTFVVNMLSVPYNAAIIAHEKMQAFAYVSLLEVSLKLGIAFLLYIAWFDSLIVYAVLIVLTSLIIRLTYAAYCKRHFKECRFELTFDRGLLKEMLSFSGWNFIGSSSAILRDQGVNIVINMFCGTAVNAARGIAMQVYSAVHGFSQNFILAVNPQIIKSYASGKMDYMFQLAFRSARFSYYLLFCISLPLILQINWLLGLWLTVVPKYTASFAILVLIFGLTEAVSIPLQYINQATGKIMVYQLVVGGLQMLNFPIAYFLLWKGLSPISTFILSIIISILCLIARLGILQHTVGLHVRLFYKEVIVRIVLVTVVGAVISVLLLFGWDPIQLIGRITFLVIVFIMACLVSLYVGCNKSEREFISVKLVAFIERLKINAKLKRR